MHLYLLPFTNALTHPIERLKTKVSEETSIMVLILCANNARAPARTKSITVTVVGRGIVLSHDDDEYVHEYENYHVPLMAHWTYYIKLVYTVGCGLYRYCSFPLCIR